jgi:hypothetical protein
MMSSGGGTTTKFNSPNASNITELSSMRYAGQMIKRPKNLPQRTLFRAKLNERRNQGRPKSRWVDGIKNDILTLKVRDWTYCAQDRQSWKDLLLQALTKYWL